MLREVVLLRWQLRWLWRLLRWLPRRLRRRPLRQTLRQVHWRLLRVLQRLLRVLQQLLRRLLRIWLPAAVVVRWLRVVELWRSWLRSLRCSRWLRLRLRLRGAGCRRLPPWLGKRVVVVVRYFEGRRVHWRARAGVRSGRGTLRRTSLVCPASTLRSTTRHSAPNPHSCSAPGVPLSMAGRRRRSAHMRCALVHAHSHDERLVFE